MTVATTTIQLMNMYHKGITIKTINSAGREVGDMIKRDGLSAKGRDIVQVAPSDSGTGGLGRLCFGSYTYVWNTPENLRSRDASAGVAYDDDPNHNKVVFARVADPDGSLCKATRGQYPKVITKGAPMNAVEVLGDKDTGLAIHNISLTDLFVDSSPPRCAPRRNAGGYAPSMPPARWSPRCTTRPNGSPTRDCLFC